MPTIGTNYFTFADLAKRMDPNLKDVAGVVEVLSQSNDILKFLPFTEGNLPTGHRTTLRAGLPTVGTRRINQGVLPSKSKTKQVDEGTMLVEAYSEADTELLRLGGNEGAIRASEDVATLEAMNQFFASILLYGNPAQYIDRFLGIAPRFSSKSGEYGAQILDAGGTGSDNTSIYLVGLGENGLHGIYPSGTNAGIERKDMGEQLLEDAGGTRRVAKVTRFVWHAGIAVKNYRHIVRIANIDVSDLATFGSGSDVSANLLRLLIQATNIVPQNSGYNLKYVILMNSTTKTWADIQVMEKKNGAFTLKEIEGKEFISFRGWPVILTDAITNAESRVV